jgi:cell division septal protein FtsQ
MNPFSLAIPFGLIGPALAVGVLAYLWRSSLEHFWWFIGIGGVASYVLMAACLTWALSDIGVTGNLTATPRPALDPLGIRYLSFMLAWLAGSAVILFLTRHLLAKI